MNYNKFIEKFQVPEQAFAYIDKIFTEQEIHFVIEINQNVFNAMDIAEIVESDSKQFIQNAYRRGIISFVDEENGLYELSNFYNRLDIFSISENEVYRSIDKKGRVDLDDWYFDTYYNNLDQNPTVRPTSDEILPLDQVLEFIDNQDRTVYLNHCDCRSLSGDCNKPIKTCITYRNGINSFVHRGLSEEIDKERAKEVVIRANKAGLMHTVNPNGICNCCGDCCYLFRGQERRKSEGFWPKTEYIIQFDENQCIGCKKCMRQCNFGVFEGTENRKVQIAHLHKCVGCGICADNCPTQALLLKGRNTERNILKG